MVQAASVVGRPDLREIAEEVARSLSRARMIGTSAFVTTPVLYANGTHVVCRLIEGQHGYEVSDNGEAALIADTMMMSGAFAKAAEFVAHRGTAQYDRRTFFIEKVRREQLAGAVALVASASAQAIERLIFTAETKKARRSRSVFEERVRTAFGKRLTFNSLVRGATSDWEFDAVIRGADNSVQAVFEFVPPAYSAVASSYMKLSNLRGLTESPRAVVVLADYDNTPAALRATLNTATDQIIAAEAPVEDYLQQAA